MQYQGEWHRDLRDREAPLPGMIGRSEPFGTALCLIRKLAMSDATVLIQGETDLVDGIRKEYAKENRLE